MAGKLSARKAASLGPGIHSDGEGLYLVVSPETLSRNWIYRFSWRGRRPEMGLGSMGMGVGLADARAARDEARRLLRAGINPIAARREAKAEKEGRKTFGEVADALFEAKMKGWRHPRHAKAWRVSLEQAAAPLRPIPVNEVDTEAVLRVLKPIWLRTPDMGARLRSRLEMVLDAAAAQGLRSGENPARWRGHLKHLLPSRPKLEKQHFAALPYADVPGLIAKLRDEETATARALEFLILTAARKTEVLGATFSEIDRDSRVWIVPARRMKSGREHRVPLCDRAFEILSEAESRRVSDYIFPGRRRGSPLSHITMQGALDRAGVKGATIHGFRSSFRDWAGNETHFPREVAEVALAHAVGDETERAYRRADALEKRRELMDAWARYCEPKEEGGAAVLAFKKPG
ncbi:hypothetical protein AMST5_04080 [freshwater sediment metagenome]|uniref:Tyr recombinase domain-containing protein n=1 Tax=freshwater sediment metagenome TaxID=556182 RepID=A0AA48RAU9_9ZZZZ